MSNTDEAMRMLREIHAAVCGSRGSAPPACTETRPSGKHDAADPVVKVQPKTWKGDDMRGRRFSECPPEFLGQLSHLLDAFADKNEQDNDPQRQRYAKWDRENADTARRWRAKLGAQTELPGSRPPVEREFFAPPEDDDIPL